MAARQSITAGSNIASTTYVASYVGPNTFSVSGNQATVFACGDVVYLQEMNAVSGVVESIYDGASATTVYLSDAILVPGLVRVNRVNRKISENLCTTAGAISGGDAVGLSASNAFDGLASTQWACSQTGSGVWSVAYIGNVFATAKRIRWVRLLQYSPTSVLSKVVLQYYNGSSWVTTQNITLHKEICWQMIVFAAPATASTQWRLLADEGMATGSSWQISGLEMGE